MCSCPNRNDDASPCFVFDVSWEIGNPSSRVHTVLAAKAEQMVSFYGDAYLVVGPNLWERDPDHSVLIPEEMFPELVRDLKAIGIQVKTGRWNVPGRPRCMIVDFSKNYRGRNGILESFWKDYAVDSLPGDWDYVEPVLFGYTTGQVIAHMLHLGEVPRDCQAVAQWHGWEAGAGMLHLKKNLPEIASVFTCHATVLGRAIAASGQNLAGALADIRPVERAASLGVAARFSLESALVRECDCLSAVSEPVAVEVRAFTGRQVDVMLPNALPAGFTALKQATRDKAGSIRADLFGLAAHMTGQELDQNETLLLMAAGGYEFVNKGINLTIDTLGELNRVLAGQSRRILCILAYPTGVVGPRRDVLESLHDGEKVASPLVCPHELSHENEDAILKALRQHGLNNGPNDAVQVLYIPVILNGKDRIIAYTYDEMLAAIDMFVAPAFYDPWGYSAMECMAHGIPAVISDVSGLAKWLADQTDNLPDHILLERRNVGYDDARKQLAAHIQAYLHKNASERAALGEQLKQLVMRANWMENAGVYREAYRFAIDAKRGRFMSGRHAVAPPITEEVKEKAHRPMIGFKGKDDPFPLMRPFTVANLLPKPLSRLRELAYNLWWSWNPDAENLFRELEPKIWTAANHNPVQFLDAIPQEILNRAAEDSVYLERVNGVLARFDAYMAQRRESFSHPYYAYFCMEFGLAECLPIYSGGLGVLAGDHLKAASDEAVPLVAVGLAYRAGYFVQRIDHDGNQVAEPSKLDFSALPMKLVKNSQGEEFTLHLNFPGRDLTLQIWKVSVGAVELYLLDADHPNNSESDRGLTSSLYGGDQEMRLQQEIILGIGGREMLQFLGYSPVVYHMNEGHASFLVFSRMSGLMKYLNLDMPTALEYCRQTSVFTTHTPVPAGHDAFPEALMRPYFSFYKDLLHCTWEDMMGMGRLARDDHEERFSMTLLGFRGAAHVNGVSKIHGGVSRENFHHVIPGFHESEVPIGHITNGVHLQTWLAPEWRPLLTAQMGEDWSDKVSATRGWERLLEMPDDAVLEVKRTLKAALLKEVGRRLKVTWQLRGDSPLVLGKMLEGLREDALVIGFARRFATYKRATLLFKQLDTLAEIIGQADRPVVFLFAGKAHPADGQGQALIREIFQLTKSERFLGKVFLLENYDMALAKHLVRGCDIWLNTPTRPQEASGTSGMKSAMNGGLNLSIADGWWAEGYNGRNGWVIGGGRVYHEQSLQNELDSQHLYGLLKNEVVPLYFGEDGRPTKQWVSMMREAIVTAIADFSAERMLADYVRLYYDTAREKAKTLASNHFSLATEVSHFKNRAHHLWDSVRIEEVQVSNVDRESISYGEDILISVKVDHGRFKSHELQVQFVTGDRDTDGKVKDPEIVVLAHEGEAGDGNGLWRGSYTPRNSGPKAYGVRVIPRYPDGHHGPDMDLGLVKWA